MTITTFASLPGQQAGLRRSESIWTPSDPLGSRPDSGGQALPAATPERPCLVVGDVFFECQRLRAGTRFLEPGY